MMIVKTRRGRRRAKEESVEEEEDQTEDESKDEHSSSSSSSSDNEFSIPTSICTGVATNLIYTTDHLDRMSSLNEVFIQQRHPFLTSNSTSSTIPRRIRSTSKSKCSSSSPSHPKPSISSFVTRSLKVSNPSSTSPPPPLAPPFVHNDHHHCLVLIQNPSHTLPLLVKNTMTAMFILLLVMITGPLDMVNCLQLKGNSPGKVQANIGEDVVLRCEFDFPNGVPIPYVVQWQKLGNKIPLYIWYVQIYIYGIYDIPHIDTLHGNTCFIFIYLPIYMDIFLFSLLSLSPPSFHLLFISISPFLHLIFPNPISFPFCLIENLYDNEKGRENENHHLMLFILYFHPHPPIFLFEMNLPLFSSELSICIKNICSYCQSPFSICCHGMERGI